MISGLTKGKHVIAEIGGVRCTVVESGITESRMRFLKEILEFNKYEVLAEAEKKEDAAAAVTYIIGVTDLVYNPVIAIYANKLFLPDGRIISPAYWNQQTEKIDPRYYRFREKKLS
ncbi:MAG: hypothetical protein NTU44_18270 [Bacteroidetes bacterium]|nr:hypothetical protein [Bacteroidota bacterium]